jgi:hypothetical protein
MRSFPGQLVRIKTWEGCEADLRLHATPALGAFTLAEVTPLHIQRLYGELMAGERPLSGGTVLNLHLVLTQAFGQAVRWDMIVRSPVTGAQPPRPRRSEPVIVGHSSTCYAWPTTALQASCSHPQSNSGPASLTSVE